MKPVNKGNVGAPAAEAAQAVQENFMEKAMKNRRAALADDLSDDDSDLSDDDSSGWGE